MNCSEKIVSPVDVIMPELPHELHLLHDVTGDVLLAVEPKLLYPDEGSAVPGRLALGPEQRF